MENSSILLSCKYFLVCKGYTFNHLTEMHKITKANKLDRSYDFYIRKNMHAVEWKFKVMTNKNKCFVKIFDRI